MDFSKLKRQSGDSNLDKLKKKVQELSQSSEGGDKSDNHFWKPEVDKAGNGMAVIRFLPAAQAEEELKTAPAAAVVPASKQADAAKDDKAADKGGDKKDKK